MSQQIGIVAVGAGRPEDIPTPVGRNLSFFLNINDGNRLYAKRSDGTAFIVPTGPAPVDQKVSISANDTTPNYLEPKLVAGPGITLTKNNPGGNETITIGGSTPAYGFVTSLSSQNVANNAHVVFDQITSNSNVTLNADMKTIEIPLAGTYKIDFSACVTIPPTF